MQGEITRSVTWPVKGGTPASNPGVAELSSVE